jgi:hypothetical protein
MHTLWDSIRSSVERVVETENEHAKTIGIKEGIDQINASFGIDDPVVCFVPTGDDYVCDECRRLHLLPDGVTPRVWRSSEVESGYHKRGVDRPSWQLLHPHCRCALATVLKGFGFDKGGKVTFISNDHDELAYQRSYKRPPRGEAPRLKRIGKSEEPTGEPLEKAEGPRDIVVTLPGSKRAEVEAEEADVARRQAAGEQGITYHWDMGRLPREVPAARLLCLGRRRARLARLHWSAGRRQIADARHDHPPGRAAGPDAGVPRLPLLRRHRGLAVFDLHNPVLAVPFCLPSIPWWRFSLARLVMVVGELLGASLRGAHRCREHADRGSNRIGALQCHPERALRWLAHVFFLRAGFFSYRWRAAWNPCQKAMFIWCDSAPAISCHLSGLSSGIPGPAISPPVWPL